MALVAVLAGERGEPQETEGRRRVARWDRVVLGILAARDQLLVVVRRREEAAALGVREAVDHRLGRLTRGVEPADLEGRLVERQQRLDQIRVVLEVGVELRLALLPGPQEVPLGVAHPGPDELRTRSCRVEVVGATEHRSGVGERGDRERVPGENPLVVETGPDARGALPIERLACLRRGGVEAGLRRRRRDGGCCVPRSCPPARRRSRRSARRPRRRGRPRRGPTRSPPASRRRTDPPRPRSRRRAPSRSRPPPRASRPASSRASARRSRASARGRGPGGRADRRGPAERCRRASSRNGARARPRRPSSGRTRRRSGR